MKIHYIYSLTIIIVSIIISFSYFYINIYSINVADKILYIYDRVNSVVDIYGQNGKVENKKYSIDNNYIKSSNSVSISAKFDAENCTKEYPISIAVTNNSPRRIAINNIFT